MPSLRPALAAAALLLGVPGYPATPVACDLSGFTSAPGLAARPDGDGVALEWDGAAGERVRLALGVAGGAPTIRELALARGGGAWTTVARDVGVEYRVVEGLRRISNQQLEPLRDLGVSLTRDIVDRYKWDVFWDAPLDLSEPTGAGNPPPAEGVAGQPGLPRSPDEIRRGSARFDAATCAAERDGARLRATFGGLTLGSFTGALVVTAFRGTNLVRVEAVASTDLPSVAYKYDVGLTGLPVGPDSRVLWRDLANRDQAYGLRGPANADPVTLRAANRLVVAETGGGAVAAFPPPHTFFWAREVEVNVGYGWYRKDGPSAFSFGVRQGEEEVVERYRANWSLYSAPPGSEQHMAAFFYPTLGGAEAAFDAALAFTRGDVYAPLPGWRVLGSHYHTDVARSLMAAGGVDQRLPDFEALRAAGIEIAGPVDRPRPDTHLEELRWLFEGAQRHSDDTFVVLPELENYDFLGGHYDMLFSHPTFFVESRPPGTPLTTEDPELGRLWHLGSPGDVMAMVEAEDMLIFMPHPRTKGSTGYPDAVKDTDHFLNDRYRGVGWRWGMGSDLSEERLSGKRVIPLLDDMNNWIADTALRPKYLLGITETYAKAPGDDVYANGPVTYLRMDALPTGADWSPVIDALSSGDHWVTSGEVLVPSHRVEGSGRGAALMAEVRWTFPLDFVEVVTGDGETVTTRRVSATDLAPFGTHTFRVPFDATGQAWVRFAAWDAAGNGAMTMPVRLGR